MVPADHKRGGALSEVWFACLVFVLLIPSIIVVSWHRLTTRLLYPKERK